MQKWNRGVKDLLRKKVNRPEAKPQSGAVCTMCVQTAPRDNMAPFGMAGQALAGQEYGLYEAMRRSVPLIDAALDKIVRLTGGFTVVCDDKAVQPQLESFLTTVPVGTGRWGLRQFMASHLDSLLTYGNAAGEIVLDAEGRDIFALYNAPLKHISVRAGANPLEGQVLVRGEGLDFKPVPYPELVLFTPLNPEPGALTGVSLLRSLPFVTTVLMKIYSSISTNFERLGNLRYAVTYRPGAAGLDGAAARDIAGAIAREWGTAMSGADAGLVKDFVAVGDVDIKVIGADNQMMDTEVPARQMLEQIVAKLGIPPFMLGLHWSTTERMSVQQADILTSELESYRILLTGVILKICRLWLRLKGLSANLTVEWEDINLQDEIETARAQLLTAQAQKLQVEGAEKGAKG